MARARGLLCLCAGVAVAVFGRSVVRRGRCGDCGGRVCAGTGGRGAVGRIAEQVVEGKGVAR